MLMFSVIVLTLGHQLWLWHRGWRFNALSPYFLCDMMLLSLIGLGSRTAELIFTSILEEILFYIFILTGIIAFYLGLHARLGFAKLHINYRLDIAYFHKYIIQFRFYILIVMFLSIFMYWLYTTTQVGVTLTAVAVARYSQIISAGLGALPTILLYIITYMMMIEMFFLLEEKNYILFFIYYALMVGVYIIVASTRVPLLSTLLIPVAYYHYTIRRINIVLVIGTLLVAPILLTISHGLRGGNPWAWTVQDRLRAETSVLKDLNILWNEYYYGKIELEYGKNYYFYTLIGFIPKALWREKPLTAFETRWTQHLYGGLLSSEGYPDIHTFTPWGEGLVQFGWIGSLLNLFLYGWLVQLGMRFFSNRTHACIVYFYYSILTSVFIRTSTQALLTTAILFIISVLTYERLFIYKQKEASR
ncbi:MAG: hypothetical protein C4337_02055 [Armatimonadota bacterium]